MSGQYPPPNPYSGHHQRAQSSPWAHSHPQHPQTHQSGMVWSPHVGLPARGAQIWPPKPMDSRPLYGLQMMMGAPQQEETMDLSSSAQDVPKMLGDPLRNGTVNGEATSVIATNPFREAAPPVDPINCSKKVEEATKMWEDSDSLVHDPEKTCSSPVLVPEEVAVEHISKHDSTDLDRLSDFSFSDNFTKGTEEQSSQSLVSENKSDYQNVDSSTVAPVEPSKPNESHSYLDASYLSVDTDESRLIVAESSADDIFEISPVDNATDITSQETEKSESSSGVISLASESTSDKLTDNPTPREQLPLRSEMSVVPTSQPRSGPDPSVENVEILLESMFNSQEETSCSSQTSSSGLPQSVIVSSGPKLPVETAVPPVDMITPMKEEELAKTLAEDIQPESDIKEENEELHDENKDELVDVKSNTVADEPKIVVEDPELPNSDENIKKEPSDLELSKDDHENEKINQESTESVLPNSTNDAKEQIQEEEKTLENETGPILTSNPEPSSSNNPFIEVETQLEKMFAGIVESVDEVSSDTVIHQSGLEPVKLATGKKLPQKRKKANSRRPSDNSVFGGSSGESVLIKKKGRKRLRDSNGNEKSAKKIKLENGESLKKGKTVKENINDGLCGKLKGPFVHIEGSKESPDSVVVVNSGSRLEDDDGVEKTNTRWKQTTQKPEGIKRKSGSAYNSSTLSLRYNSDTPDNTWVCVFCKRGPHCVGGLGGEPAGDLFGPYRVPLIPPADDVPPPGTPADEDITEEQKRRGGGKFPKSLRTCGSVETFVQKVAKKGKRSSSHEGLDHPGLLPVGDSYEVWLHAQCAIWAPGLCIMGPQLVGLEDTVWNSLRTKCLHCGVLGAALGCAVHNCPDRMHYPCAQVSGWLLDQDTFITRCQTHRTRLRP